MRFAVLALPRSGTAWAANWLTSNGILCLHDPLFDYRPQEIPQDVGIACTGSWLAGLPDCPYVLLHRPLNEINQSCQRAGIPPVPDHFYTKFSKLPGARFDWRDLFRNPEPIWRALRGDHFDVKRHRHLCKLIIQRDVSQISVSEKACEFVRPFA